MTTTVGSMIVGSFVNKLGSCGLLLSELIPGISSPWGSCRMVSNPALLEVVVVAVLSFFSFLERTTRVTAVIKTTTNAHKMTTNKKRHRLDDKMVNRFAELWLACSSSCSSDCLGCCGCT